MIAHPRINVSKLDFDFPISSFFSKFALEMQYPVSKEVTSLSHSRFEKFSKISESYTCNSLQRLTNYLFD